VIYPSVDTEQFDIFDENYISQILAIEWIWFQNKDYYISFSRLTHAKQIDTIIRAFAQMPDKNILILYGEHDSQRNEFMRLGAWYPNIVFHALSDNNHLPYIISGAIASICISQNEDFGMVAIESMACGIPVIAVDEWGYRESMIPGKTWYLIDPHDLEDNLVRIIQHTSPETLANMQADCRGRAQDFSLTAMNKRIQGYIV
jgi:glycosyltransferase involved in cell wall biosynthesis